MTATAVGAQAAPCMGSILDSEAPAVGAQGQHLHGLLHSDLAPGVQMAPYWLRMPPGFFTRAHIHTTTETQPLVLRGFAASLLGEELEPYLHRPGDVLLIPPGVVHAAVNLSVEQDTLALEYRLNPVFNADTHPPEGPGAPWMVEWDKRVERVARRLQIELEQEAQRWAQVSITDVCDAVDQRLAAEATR